MPRAAVETHSRMSLRIHPDQKKLLLRAVELEDTDLTGFVLRHSLSAARNVIEQSEKLQLSGRDSKRVLELLEKPPAPNRRLLAAARALPHSR